MSNKLNYKIKDLTNTKVNQCSLKKTLASTLSIFFPKFLDLSVREYLVGAMHTNMIETFCFVFQASGGQI